MFAIHPHLLPVCSFRLLPPDFVPRLLHHRPMRHRPPGMDVQHRLVVRLLLQPTSEILRQLHLRLPAQRCELRYQCAFLGRRGM